MIALSILSSNLIAPIAIAASEFWQDKKIEDLHQEELKRLVTEEVFRELKGDFDELKSTLQDDSNKLHYLTLPMPNGESIEYVLEPNQILSKSLSKKYSDLKQFKGHATQDSSLVGFFDLSRLGFRGEFNTPSGKVVLDPISIGNPYNYAAFFKSQSSNTETLNLNEPNLVSADLESESASLVAMKSAASTPSLYTFRLAIAASYEFAKHYTESSIDSNSDKNVIETESAYAAIVSMVVRLNEVFQRDLGIKLELVTDSSTIVGEQSDSTFTNSTNDLKKVGDFLSSKNVKEDTYDVGHVLNTGGGGVASLRSVCVEGAKANGVSGTPNPEGDAFIIDFVAHELGHQFGANHTFNANNAFTSCEDNRVAKAAVEPGSGSSIMSYAGLCGSLNLQQNTSPYFHAYSIEEITDYVQSVASSSCGTPAEEENQVPAVDAGDDIVIPAKTPFLLTGSANDPESDSLTYIWEQMDTGNASTSTFSMRDNGCRALFRSWEPDESSTRFLPRLSDLVDGTLSIGETYPVSNRSMNFRLTVRQKNQIGSNFDDKVVTVDANSGPFQITEPTTTISATMGDTINIEWDVANTDVAPVNCSNVDILLSDDNAATFGNDANRTLASGIANTGSATVLIPNINANNASIMLRCSNNDFFAVAPNKTLTSFINATSSGQQSCVVSTATMSQSKSSSSSRVGASTTVYFLPFVFLIFFRNRLREVASFNLLSHRFPLLVLSIFVVFLSGCHQVQEGESMADKLIEQAKSEKDFRLISPGGRGEPIPGIPAEKFKQVRQQCGIRIVSLKDFLESDSDWEVRKETINQMERYNLEIWPLCKSQFDE